MVYSKQTNNKERIYYFLLNTASYVISEKPLKNI